MPTVAEPHPHHLFLHAEPVGDVLHLLAAGLWVGVEGPLEGHPDRVVNGGSLLPPPGQGFLCSCKAGCLAHQVGLGCLRGVGVLQPLGQQRLQLAHVLEGEVERLEARDGRLGEVVTIQLAQR